LRVKTVWNNIYSILNEKPKRLICYFVTVFFFLILYIFLNHEFSSIRTFQGIYQCGKECTVTCTVPYDISKNLKREMEIILEDQIFPLKIKTFGKVEFLSNSIVVQSLILEIPKLDYYEKQTISFSIVMDTEPFYQIIIDSMKGGDI